MSIRSSAIAAVVIISSTVQADPNTGSWKTFHLVLCAEKLKADISTLYFKNDYEYGNEASRILVFRDDHQTIKEAEHNGKWEPLSSKFANSFGICQ